MDEERNHYEELRTAWNDFVKDTGIIPFAERILDKMDAVLTKYFTCP